MAYNVMTRTEFNSLGLVVAMLIAGCAGPSGVTGLSLLGSGEPAGEASASAQVQLATATAEDMPPLPTRRPGKRGRNIVAKTDAATPAIPPSPDAAQSPEPEGSGLTLASLGQISLFSGPSSPDSVLIAQPPVAAYTLLAQRIRACWLTPGSPKLTNHGFHAEVAPGDIKEAKIILYERADDGRRGVSAFRIDITAESSGALISSQNTRLEQKLDVSFKADLARWAKGDERCKA